ncbi:MAG TPA: HAD family hydrolase [Clostridiales bacterium]|nr:HAD family hydrolase [Clostridiales bacterium]
MKNNIKGIIFDMDNTLLSSKINFAAMKKETYEFVINHGILPDDLDLINQTTAIIIEKAVKTKMMSQEIIKAVWEIPKKYEVMGMENAVLEPGVTQLLSELYGKYYMAVVTNNSIEAAVKAFRENKIYSYFDILVGREMIKSLKPSPDGFLYILDHYNTTSTDEWLSIGDAWLDGKASMDAGIRFISYRGDIQKMNTMGVYPYAVINDIRELSNFI